MKHCRLLPAFLRILFWSVSFAGESAAAPSSATATSRPNIILILADDLGYGSLGCYGSTTVRTPNIDRLAAEGLRLTDFHSNGALCTPTRAALLTGRYQQRCAWVPDEDLSPVFREQRAANPTQRWAWGISPKEVTLASVLRDAGYRTGLIGKWHLGYDVRFHPMNYGFDEFRGFMGGNVDYHTHVAGYGLKQLDWWNGRKIENEPGYTTDLLTKYAVEFIAHHRERPFFLYLTHAAPHDPWQSRDPALKRSPADNYRNMIETLDESVGAIVAALHAQQLEQRTLLIFCSDNGAAAPRGVPANGRLRGNKNSFLEGGHRVPCIASWPGVISPGRTSSETVMSMDFFPTFVSIASAAAPRDHKIDGMNLLPLFRDGPAKSDRILHWLSGDAWAVRQGPWKLSGQGSAAVTLVNLDADIEEKTNRLNDEPKRVADLTALHQRWIEEVGRR